MSDPIDTLNASDDVKARLRSLRDEVEAAIPYETLALRAEVASLTATLTAERQRAKMGRPPKPPGTTGKRVNLYLSAEASEALEEMTKPGERSALVSRLLVEERERRRS